MRHEIKPHKLVDAWVMGRRIFARCPRQNTVYTRIHAQIPYMRKFTPTLSYRICEMIPKSSRYNQICYSSPGAKRNPDTSVDYGELGETNDETAQPRHLQQPSTRSGRWTEPCPAVDNVIAAPARAAPDSTSPSSSVSASASPSVSGLIWEWPFFN